MIGDHTETAGHRPLLRVVRVHPAAVLPSPAHPGDAGVDLVATAACVLPPGARAVVPTGLVVAIPMGWAGLIHPRSGLAARHGVTVLNAPGTIDAGYRGEVAVILHNTDPEASFEVHVGDRIAQLVLVEVGQPLVIELDDVAALEATDRGDGGFGSTGVASGA